MTEATRPAPTHNSTRLSIWPGTRVWITMGSKVLIRQIIHRVVAAGGVNQPPWGSGTAGTWFINGLLKKRLFSSPAAFASTLEKHVATLEGRREKKATPMEDRILRKAILKAEEDYADDRKAEDAQLEAIEEATKHEAQQCASVGAGGLTDFWRTRLGRTELACRDSDRTDCDQDRNQRTTGERWPRARQGCGWWGP